MNLSEAEVGKECIISDIVTDDEEMKSFLFSLENRARLFPKRKRTASCPLKTDATTLILN